jgi:hypothetical protein
MLNHKDAKGAKLCSTHHHQTMFYCIEIPQDNNNHNARYNDSVLII